MYVCAYACACMCVGVLVCVNINIIGLILLIFIKYKKKNYIFSPNLKISNVDPYIRLKKIKIQTLNPTTPKFILKLGMNCFGLILTIVLSFKV